jgi:hypothetical protein
MECRQIPIAAHIDQSCPIKRCEIYNLCVENLALNRLRVNATLASRGLNSRIGAMQHIEERSTACFLAFFAEKNSFFSMMKN